MGEMADYYSEQSMFDEFDEAREAQVWGEINRGVWTTREGKRVEITKMSDDHLLNLVKYLEKVNGSRGGFLARGTHPEELDTDDLIDGWISRLQGEIARRGLNAS